MKRLLVVPSLSLALLTLWSCSSPNKAPSNAAVERSAPVATRTEPEPKRIPQKEAVDGAHFNKVFPKSSGEFHLTFTQEKDGFAAANLTKGAVKLATFSVSDTDANPTARDKFKASSRQIAGYPAAPVGAQGTAVLVADRFQVQIRSLSPAFTAADRQAWLERFKLDELAQVRK